jgi:hypothetical protein
MSLRYAFAFIAAVLIVGTAQAQTSQAQASHPQTPQPEPRDAWLMQNYRFTGPPPPGDVRPYNPVTDIQDVQNTLLAILRKANFAGDGQAALAAAYQAAENAQLLASMTAPPKQLRTRGPEPVMPTFYLIALKDQSIHAASTYWMDGSILHYLTPQGAHEQVRLDLVDLNFTTELNRQLNREFRLPQPRDQIPNP